MRTDLLKRSGLALCAVGGLLLAFVAFQLWGTSFSEHSAQARLRSQLESQLHPHHPSPSAGVSTTGASSDTPTLNGPALADATPQPSAGAPVGLLSIPRIGISNDAIVQGVDTDQLREGPGHYPGTPLPGQAGNVAIAGHRTTYAAPFYNLNELQAGDPIIIQTVQGTFRYGVTQSKIVAPDDNAVLDNTPDAELTLTTCTPRYSATQRLVVVAVLRSSQPASVAHLSAGTRPQHPPAGRGTSSGLLLADGGTGEVTAAVLWGLGAAILASLVAVAWRRSRRPVPRWATVAVGVPGILAVVFVFFGHLSSLLPASF